MTDRNDLAVSASENCPECGEVMPPVDVPVEHSVCLFGVEFIVRRWTQQRACIDCAAARETERIDGIWQDGARHGYDEGRKDAAEEYARRYEF